MSSSAPTLATIDLADLEQASGGLDWGQVGAAALRGGATGGGIGMATGLAVGTALGVPVVGGAIGGAGGALGGAVVGALENIVHQPRQTSAPKATSASGGAYPAP